MASMLSRLGRFSYRKRWVVVALWLLALSGVVLLAVKSEGPVSTRATMPGIESQEAFDLIEERFPGAAADGGSATVVFVAPPGQTLMSAENAEVVDATLASISSGPQVLRVIPPSTGRSISADGSTGFASVSYEVPASELTEESRTALADAVEQARGAGLTAEMSGSALKTSAKMSGVELAGVAVAAVVLLMTFGSMVAAGLPLLTAIIGVAISFLGVWTVAGPLDMAINSGILALMLGLAVGIDYAMFVVSRFREERLGLDDAEQAAGRAVGTAGSAVVFAGLTVVIALAGLSVVGIPLLAKMGLAAAGAVVVAVAVALTLVPALLGFAPNRVLSRAQRRGSLDSSARRSVARPWMRLVLRRPLLITLAGVALLAAIAVPALSLQLGTPGDASLSTTETQRRAYDLRASAFGPGSNGPLTVVVDARGAADPEAAVATVADSIRLTSGVVSVSEPTFNQEGDTAILTAVPSTSPTDERTEALVETLRAARPGVEAEGRVSYEITGTTALDIDMAQKMQSALVPYVGLVIGLAVLLLLVVFRSIWIPLTAALGFLLSLFAAFGVIVAVFQWGWAADLLGVQQTGPVMSLMPILLVGIVFGLAMDYQVFLVSRMREAHVHGKPAQDAITTGFQQSSRVVVAAAVIMIAVFGGFAAAHEPLIKMVGLGLACAVFFDAFVVRLTLMPAVMQQLGERAWWLPRWLDRVLPRVDVEGQSLEVEDGSPIEQQPEPAEAMSAR
ncbi:MMPL family transporter [Auraticoccus monumenti]|uniref:Putative drug exporter of the RND superfamily n=1 Tax=Auraticoccus monumenti TaxID=675864 RepID=A0A1G6Y3G8_9ACTN|nr:MMPL family transporter [Auraticoccus monumenti]SDD84175.1 putative drug exporter of the RND superfamily [Auraticoccus monumenti]